MVEHPPVEGLCYFLGADSGENSHLPPGRAPLWAGEAGADLGADPAACLLTALREERTTPTSRITCPMVSEFSG